MKDGMGSAPETRKTVRVIDNLRHLLRRLAEERLLAQLLRGAIGGAGIQAAGIALKLLVSIVLARALGPDGYGIYAHAAAIMTLLMVSAELGVPALLVREVAAAEGQSAWGLLRGALRRGRQLVLVTSTVTCLCGLIVLFALHNRVETDSFWTMAVMMLVLPFAAIVRTMGSGLRGLHRVITAQALEIAALPLLLVLLVGTVFLVLPDLRSPTMAMALQLCAAIAVAGVAALLLHRSVPTQARAATPVYQTRQWIGSALPFGLIAAALVVTNQADVILLGWFVSPAEVGIYRVAAQGAMMVSVSLVAVASVATPMLARLHATNDHAGLQRVVTLSVRSILAPAIILTLVLLIEGETLITLLFGAEFAPGYDALLILAFGQLASAAFGISGSLLSMSGFEVQVTKTIWMAALANILLNLVLIPAMGVTGAALATALALGGWSLHLASVCRRRMGIRVSPF